MLSIWIVVDETENSLFHLMTQCLHHSDLIPVSPAIKTYKVLVDSACLHLSSSERGTFLNYFSPPSDQLISAVQRDQTGWNLLEVWIWRSPSIEEYGNKTFTWTKQGSQRPPAREEVQGNLIRHNTFSTRLPHHNVDLKESQQSGLRTMKREVATWRNKDVPLASMCLGGTEKDSFKKNRCWAANFPPQDELKCSNQQYSRFPDGEIEAPTYESHEKKQSPRDNRGKKVSLRWK